MTLIVIARHREPQAAHLTRALLESAGIPARVADEHLVGANWLYSDLVGGVKVLVPADLASDAQAILDGQPSELAPDDEDRSEQPRAACPYCGEPAVSLASADRQVRAFGMLAGVPVTIGRFRMRCTTCNRSWREQPSHRGVLRVLADVAALFAIVISLVFSPFVRFRTALLLASLECWSCRAHFRRGATSCPSCGIPLPESLAYARLVRPGRAYDGICASCRLPFASADFAGDASPPCAACGSPLRQTRPIHPDQGERP